jgi:cytochrome c-type biogenesis protein CcmE
MKLKHIVALVIAIGFIGVAAIALVDNKIDYSDFQKAERTGSRVQVAGSLVKEKSTNYDPKSNVLTFHMKDKQGIEMPVRFVGMKPNNFDIAPSVVCVGKVEDGVFQVTDIQTKCPSRYEGSGNMQESAM